MHGLAAMSACFRFCTLVNRDAIMSPNQSQASQQVQQVNIFRGTELWADEVQVKRADAVHALQGLLRLMKNRLCKIDGSGSSLHVGWPASAVHVERRVL